MALHSKPLLSNSSSPHVAFLKMHLVQSPCVLIQQILRMHVLCSSLFFITQLTLQALCCAGVMSLGMRCAFVAGLLAVAAAQPRGYNASMPGGVVLPVLLNTPNASVQGGGELSVLLNSPTSPGRGPGGRLMQPVAPLGPGQPVVPAQPAALPVRQLVVRPPLYTETDADWHARLLSLHEPKDALTLGSH